ncbi:T-cell immunomodulatory protein [Clonorchis sinensis]|uniref:T-cell immunomodulatory protein n=1 Tax=Clonorchis sinensis TaxID=79923 RepID=A0A8T1M3Q0_CLOSI|nr:T-cell immunomodulatory protein [Clonorchis sinensis]
MDSFPLTAFIMSVHFSSAIVTLFVSLLLDLGRTQDSSVPSSSSGPSGSTFQTAFTWNGYLLACFADLNADRQMDVVLLDAAGTDLFVSLAPSTRSSLTFGPTSSPNLPPPTLLLSPGLGEKIRSVAAADFNGDSLVDFMLLVSTARTGPYKIYLAYGVPGSTNLSFTIDTSTPVATTRSQPLICDLNADAVADIFGETTSDELVIIYGGSSLTIQKLAYQGPPWSSLGYSAFGDINGDTIPDIVVLVGEPGQLKFQLYKRGPTSGLSADVTLFDLPLPLRVAQQLTLGLFVLGDFDSDGKIDLLLPACTTINCVGGSSIFLYNFGNSQWQSVDVQWEPKKVRPSYAWSLAQTPADDLLLSALVGPTLGDFDLDGKPDVGMGLAYSAGTNTGTLPAVLLNQGVNSKTGRLTFQAYLLPGASLPETNTKLKQITFFDNGEKGVFDVFVVSVDDVDISSVQLFLQQMVNDHYFVKVTVLNGLCASAENCTDKRLPYGLPVPGQSSSYSTESAFGGRLGFAGLMGVQSCCTALQLPSMRYGLGPFASYVERLTVAIPPDSTMLRTFSMFGLIPNSEVFVNPYPHSDPDRWTAKLFLQPLYNMKVLYIAITLVCVCVLLVIIISVLQCLEVREDHKEKQKEAQRFHFDAM